LNGDGTIDSEDMAYHDVTMFPTAYFGINLGLSYGPFGIEAVFQGAADYWLEMDPEKFPHENIRSSAHNNAASPIWWEKGDYLKLRSLYAHYDLDFRKLSLGFFLRGLNLFSLDHLKTMDPEYVYTGYSQPRSYQAGVKLSF
ncbi:MAG: hypothetical protein HUJ94_01850, partial [Bacteroidales bacterium]|nr:hypothetical protein [Bacteroidales bacterium]